MSDDLRTIETMQENAEHFGAVVTRVTKALMAGTPHFYDPTSDDMTVEFAIQLAAKDEEIARLRAIITEAHNIWRHDFLIAAEAAAEKLFQKLSVRNTDPFARRNAAISSPQGTKS